MNGWALAAALTAAFGVGYLLRFGVCVHACSARSLRLRFLLAEANTGHTLCRDQLDERDRFIAHQEARLDAYAAGVDLPAEAAEYLHRREGGS